MSNVITDLSKYECPICLNWLNEPVLTSCGHHFCQSCITSWLVRKSPCPIDGQVLENNDVFADKFMLRELAELSINCPNSGCLERLKIANFDSHAQVCEFKRNNKLKCSFGKTGCTFEGESRTQLEAHYRHDAHRHLEMLSDEFFNGTTSKTCALVDGKMEETKFWTPESKEPTENTEDRNTNLLRSMYERIVVLEQRTSEQEIMINRQHKQLMDLFTRQRDVANDNVLLNCAGTYIWRVTNFNELLQKHLAGTKAIYSSGFYTSPFGYKFCVRLSFTKENPGFIGLHVHMMQTEHDNCLDWPFSGRISLYIIHPEDSDKSIRETMMTRPDLEAFQRPKEKFNPDGFGYKEFVRINELMSNGFINNNTLIVKISIKTV